LEDDEMSENKIVMTKADEALFKFDSENNIEPFRTVAERIAKRYDIALYSPLVDAISNALEDAHDIGVKRAPYLLAAASLPSPRATPV
jgi:hypothetical protein